MPITELDPVAALVVIDLQKGMMGRPLAHPIGEVVARTARLARAFREHGLPVVLVNVSGRAPGQTDAAMGQWPMQVDWAELMPELEPQASDLRVTKQRWGAFIGTELDQLLRQRGVTQIVLTGVATSIGVESTARSAYDHGYNVALVTDAMTDFNADAHRNSVEKIFPRLGQCDTADNRLRLLSETPK